MRSICAFVSLVADYRLLQITGNRTGLSSGNSIFAPGKQTKKNQTMKNFFTSLFSSLEKDETAEERAKNEQNNFDVLKYDGIRARRMGKTDYAIKCFTEALAIQSDFETMSCLAEAYQSVNRREDSIEVMNGMIELRPDDIPTRIARANMLFMVDRNEEAVKDCQDVIERDQESYLAWFLMAKAKKSLGNMLAVIADLTKAIAIKDDFTDAYMLRAETLLLMGQAQEALPDAEKAASLAPEEETVYIIRGSVREALGETSAAEEDYQQAIDLNPFNDDAYMHKGKLLIAGGNLDEAISFFDEAIEMRPDFASAYAERGRAKNLKGDKDGAFLDLRKSIELNPEGEEAQRIEGSHNNFEDMYKGGIF